MTNLRPTQHQCLCKKHPTAIWRPLRRVPRNFLLQNLSNFSSCMASRGFLLMRQPQKLEYNFLEQCRDPGKPSANKLCKEKTHTCFTNFENSLDIFIDETVMTLFIIVHNHNCVRTLGHQLWAKRAQQTTFSRFSKGSTYTIQIKEDIVVVIKHFKQGGQPSDVGWNRRCVKWLVIENVLRYECYLGAPAHAIKRRLPISMKCYL